jgi:diguanylate cyclase (GGDEF)-like protein/PAS domain S-box-containing protein
MCVSGSDIAATDRAKLRVLRFGPDAGILRLALTALGTAYTLQHRGVADMAALRDALQAEDWDLLLCDPAAVACDCRDALRLLNELGSDLMVVAVTEREEERVAAEIIAHGARAVLGRPRLGRLAPIVARELEDIRRRRLAELRALLQSSPDPMLVLGADGRILHSNPLLEELLGYAEAELAGQPVELLVPEPLRARHAMDRARYAAAPVPRPMGARAELTAVHKDGTPIPVDVSLGPVRLGGEQLICCGVRDLRARVRAERLLRAILEGTAAQTGEAFFGALAKSLAGALDARYAFVGEFPGPQRDRVRVLASWNGEGHAGPLEYPLAGTPGARVEADFECLVPDRVQQAFPGDRGLAALGAQSYFGVRMDSSAGAPIGLLAIADVKPLAAGDTARAVLRIFAARAAVELERMRATASLRESEEQFRVAFERAPVGMALRGLDGRWLDANPKLCEILGYSREELLGTTSVQMTPAGERDEAIRYNERMRRGELSGYSREKRYQRKDGTPIWVALTVNVVNGPDAKPRHLITVVEDITERRRQESTITRLGRVLDQSLNEIYVFDAGTLRFAQVNEGARRNLGYTMDELRALTPLDLKPEFDAEKFGRLIEPLRSGAQSVVRFATSHRRKDGSLYPVEVQLQLFAAEQPPVYVAIIQDVTEHRRAETRMRQDAARIALVAENVPAMIAYTDARYHILYANRNFAEFYGATGAAAEGRHMAEFLGAATYAAVRPGVERALAGETVRYEATRRRRDGELRHVDVTLVPHREDGGRVLGVYTFVLDVTERRRTEDELREREAELRLLADHLPAMICYVDAGYRYRYANRRYAEFYAAEAGPIEGKTIAQVAGDELWEKIRPQFDRALAGEFVNYQAERRRSADGSRRYVDVSLVPHRDGAGRVLGLYTLILDVTKRRRAEERLRLSNRAIEASVNSIMITRPTAKGQEIVYVNPAFERITGYAAAEAMGRNPRFLRGEDLEQAGAEALRNAVREGREATALLRNYRKDGTLFWNELRVAPVRDDAGGVTHFVGVSSDVSERVRYQQEIERNANYDPLTGLPNRNLLNDRVTQALVKSGRSRRPVGVVYLDLDHLKRINDSLGHAMGDQVIAAVGARLAQAVRTGDTVARVGGDEFVIVLAELTREDHAALVAEKVLKFIGTPIKIGPHEFVLTASAGVALSPKDGGDAATLLRNADTALYRAKADGRDCFRFFAAEMNERVVSFLRLEQDLRQALDLEQFRLHYQPIVHLASGRTVGAEALIRWQRGDGSMVSPAQFIPVAEESGLIVPVGRWVLNTATRQAVEWNRGRAQPLFVSVNLSARQFRDPALLDAVRAALEAAGLPGSLLKLEITETAVMQDVEKTVRWLGALKDLGVQLSIDDFGTGYSSLAYLKRFPIDNLKIDRSFVRNLPADGDDLAISRAVIDLARRLELEVVAEGIETREQREVLAANGCDMAQGYFFGRPVDPAEFMAPEAKPERKPARRKR